MSYLTIRTNLKAALEAITGIGVVHEYLRDPAGDPKKFKEFFFKQATGLINTWQFTRVARKETAINQNTTNFEVHDIHLFGFYGAKDASSTELTFQDLVDTVVVALRTEAKQPAPLSIAGSRMTWPQAPEITHVNFGKIVAHRCRIEFTFEEYVMF